MIPERIPKVKMASSIDCANAVPMYPSRKNIPDHTRVVLQLYLSMTVLDKGPGLYNRFLIDIKVYFNVPMFL
jgi:hypothetical protein